MNPASQVVRLDQDLVEAAEALAQEHGTNLRQTIEQLVREGLRLRERHNVGWPNGDREWASLDCVRIRLHAHPTAWVRQNPLISWPERLTLFHEDDVLLTIALRRCPKGDWPVPEMPSYDAFLNYGPTTLLAGGVHLHSYEGGKQAFVPERPDSVSWAMAAVCRAASLHPECVDDYLESMDVVVTPDDPWVP